MLAGWALRHNLLRTKPCRGRKGLCICHRRRGLCIGLAYSRRVKLLEEEVRRLPHAAQAERKAKLDPAGWTSS